MGGALGLDQLPRNAHPVGRLAHAPFQQIADAELAPDLPNIDGAALVRKGNVKAELREMTNIDRKRDKAVVISSTMPSEKYSCSGSALRFWNGSTTIDGLSGTGGSGNRCASAGRLLSLSTDKGSITGRAGLRRSSRIRRTSASVSGSGRVPSSRDRVSRSCSYCLR